MREDQMPLAVSYEDAAMLLSCSADHIRSLVTQGKLRKVKIGALARIRLADLEAFLEAGGTSPNARYRTDEAVA